MRIRAVRGLNYPDPAKAGLVNARGQAFEVRIEPGEEVPAGHLSECQIGDYLACGAIELLDVSQATADDLVAQAAEAATGTAEEPSAEIASGRRTKKGGGD